MTVRPTQFGTVTVNGASDQYYLHMPDGPIAAFRAVTSLRERRGRTPVRDSVAGEARVIPLMLTRNAGGTVSAAQLLQTVSRNFTPLHDGTITLTAAHPNGETVSVNGVVVSAQPREGGIALTWDIEYEVPDWRWQRTSADTVSAATAGTITNAGDAMAFPTLSIAPTAGHVRKRRGTIVDNTGRGLSNYWVRLTFDVTGTSAANSYNYYAFHKGRLIPHYFSLTGGTAANIDCRVDVDPSGTAIVDVFYHSALVNTTTNDKLDYGQIDVDNAALGNGTIVWDSFVVSTAPANATFAWVPAKVVTQPTGTSWKLASEAANGLQIELGQNFADDADAVVMTTGVECVTMSLLLRTVTGAGVAYCLIRKANQLNWTSVWSLTGTPGGTSTAANITVTDAVAIAFVLQSNEAQNSAVLALEHSGGGTAPTDYYRLSLNQTKRPTITVGNAGSAYQLHGTITGTTTGKNVVFNRFFMDAGTLTVDTDAQTVSTVDGSITYGEITFTDPDLLFPLQVGDNVYATDFRIDGSSAVTVPVGWSYRRRYVV